MADLSAYKIPVVENVGKRHNKVARTVFGDKIAIGGGARLASYLCSNTNKRAGVQVDQSKGTAICACIYVYHNFY